MIGYFNYFSIEDLFNGAALERVTKDIEKAKRKLEMYRTTPQPATSHDDEKPHVEVTEAIRPWVEDFMKGNISVDDEIAQVAYVNNHARSTFLGLTEENLNQYLAWLNEYRDNHTNDVSAKAEAKDQKYDDDDYDNDDWRLNYDGDWDDDNWDEITKTGVSTDKHTETVNEDKIREMIEDFRHSGRTYDEELNEVYECLEDENMVKHSGGRATVEAYKNILVNTYCDFLKKLGEY